VGRVTGTLNRFLVEPFVPHEQSEEYYICIYTERESNVILFHHEGGVDVGAVDEKVRILAEFVVDLHRVFDKLHFTFLEINPLVVCGWTPCGGAKSDNLFVHILDVAAKLDQCAEFLFSANSLWSPQGQSLEFPFPFGRVQTPE
ncbi:hypothetical protein X801_07660, partial [Opisthorchis viverrini]